MSDASLPTKDEAVARLEAYQERLDDAAKDRGRYDALFDNAPAGVGLHEIDASGTITRVNAREMEFLGRTAEETVGRPAWAFSVMQEASRRAVERKLAGGGLKPFVRTLSRADGTGITLAFVERYLMDASGKIAGIRTALMPIAS